MAAQPPAPPVAALLSPASVITATFSPDGTITVVQSTSADGGVTYQPVGQPEVLNASKTTFGFEFGVNTGDPKTDPSAPYAALLVERFDDWPYPWDDEVARVLGGKPYPFGTGPLPKGANSNWNVQPQNTSGGVFSGPLDVGAGAQIISIGVCGTTTQALADGGPVKHLSLWLPAGATGYLKFTPAGKEAKIFTSKK